jgi:outer membrane protein
MKTVFKRQAAFQVQKLALVLALCPVAGLQAQSLSTLYEAATRFDATYAAAKAQAVASRARGEQAKAGVYPSVNLSLGQSRTHQEVVPDGGASVNRSFGLRSASVALTQALYRPANWASFEQGKRQIQLADTVLVGADQDIMIRLAQAYFDVLAAQDNLVFIGAQKSLITEQLAAAKRNFEVGTSTITDSREAQARFDLMLAQELVAQNDLQVKQLALENVAGVPAIKPKPLQPNAPLPADMGGSMEEWVAKAVAQSPNLLQARLALDVAKLELDKAGAAHKPSLDLSASYGANDNLGGSSSSTVGSRVTAASLGLALNWPLFAGFVHQNRILEASALVDKAQADLLVAERAVAQATRTAYLGKLSLAGQIKALQAAEASSQSSLDANRLGYQVGVRINIDVLNAQSQLFQTKRDLAKARYDLLVAGLRLRQASGGLEVADLSRVNELLVK